MPAPAGQQLGAPAPRESDAELWESIQHQAKKLAADEPLLAAWLEDRVLRQDSLAPALATHLAAQIATPEINAAELQVELQRALGEPSVSQAVHCDLRAVKERDSACHSYLEPFLYFKGFHALQLYRVGHHLWQQARQAAALFLQNRASVVFAMDIHPAARIGSGIMLDHGTGLIVGETCVIEDNVSIMQGVTLGGTGKESGDRHPKIAAGVLISASATVLGNIRVGAGAKVGAGSVVLEDVPMHTTVAGVPARVVGHPRSPRPALEMEHRISSDSD